jgi:hypothetical protein
VSEDVEVPAWPRCRAVAREPLGEPLRVVRRAELVAEDEIPVGVGVPGEVALEISATVKPANAQTRALG